MAYFREAYQHLSFTPDDGADAGLRRSQIGALHALGAHFSLQDRPAIVVLPTGAGKTAVLMLAPYLLRSSRALVITQSRFVREQIASDFSALRTVKKALALPADLTPPKVIEVRNLIASPEHWEALRDYDVVVTTPGAASPAQKGVAAPPDDLFDIVLIDEAHHSPARTWNALLEAFSKAKAVLFTATPFRRDRREIRGRHVYNYPIQRAFEDGIFGDMTFVPVQPDGSATNDELLARATAQRFNADRAAGLKHALMIRADSRPRADELEDIYQRETQLRLATIHSGKSARDGERIVRELREGRLDGVICVSMLGEGFDLPNLKIAALHSPHRSLGVTLQFFGRFARVNGPDLGSATFLAVPEEIGEKMGDLFAQSEAWGKHIRLVGQARISAELRMREFLDEFEPNIGAPAIEPALEDISLQSFTVFNHVKVFQVHGDVDLHAVPQLSGFKTGRVWVNETHGTTTFLIREELRPKWASTDGLETIEYHLFVVHFHEETNLLFICATLREESLYRDIAATFVRGAVRPISLNRVNRALRSFEELELFHVGMKNRAVGTVAESYRQLAGSAVHHAIAKEDGALYHRGHVFGRGVTADGASTIGLSSLSKIWRLEHTKIPDLVDWCGRLARDIANPAPFTTGMQLDHLDAGEDIESYPSEPILAADWNDLTYRKPPLVRLGDAGSRFPLLDVELTPDWRSQRPELIDVAMSGGGNVIRTQLRLDPFPSIGYHPAETQRLQVEHARRPVDLTDYLAECPLRLHLADGSVITGGELFRASAEEQTYDVVELCRPTDWNALNVDPLVEFGDCDAPRRSIHDWLREDLLSGPAAVVFYDHRTGECADFITVEEDDAHFARILLYHCKAAGGPPSGNRVDDLYEVVGQVTKSVRFRTKRTLVQHVRRRFGSGSPFLKGDLATFIEIVEADPRHQFALQVIAVQPGVSASRMAPKLGLQLANASHGLVAMGCAPLKLICAA